MWTRRLRRAPVTGLAFFLAVAWSTQAAEPNAADAALVDRVKEAVIKELRESGALDRAVDEGVSRYVQRQRAEAAQRERLEAGAQAATLRPVAKGRDHIRGNPAAPVTPRKEAAASECAAELGGNDAFWKFADRFFELTPSNNRTDIDTVLPQIAREIGLEARRFASCLASGRHDRRIEEDYQEAIASGGRGTPWSIILSKNGKTYPLSGAQPHATVKQLVDLALREK